MAILDEDWAQELLRVGNEYDDDFFCYSKYDDDVEDIFSMLRNIEQQNLEIQSKLLQSSKQKRDIPERVVIECKIVQDFESEHQEDNSEDVFEAKHEDQQESEVVNQELISSMDNESCSREICTDLLEQHNLPEIKLPLLHEENVIEEQNYVLVPLPLDESDNIDLEPPPTFGSKLLEFEDPMLQGFSHHFPQDLRTNLFQGGGNDDTKKRQQLKLRVVQNYEAHHGTREAHQGLKEMLIHDGDVLGLFQNPFDRGKSKKSKLGHPKAQHDTKKIHRGYEDHTKYIGPVLYLMESKETNWIKNKHVKKRKCKVKCISIVPLDDHNRSKPTQNKDPLKLPNGPITRARLKRFKETMASFVRSTSTSLDNNEERITTDSSYIAPLKTWFVWEELKDPYDLI